MTREQTISVLRAARELISDPARWTQDVMARDRDGVELRDGYDTGAVCFCAEGAIEHITGHDLGFAHPALAALVVAVRELGEGGVTPAGYNDSHSHPEVVALFDRAIVALETHT